jgi:hypothetical protein
MPSHILVLRRVREPGLSLCLHTRHQVPSAVRGFTGKSAADLKACLAPSSPTAPLVACAGCTRVARSLAAELDP